ncbi:tripartite tricarboxylate transporter substrate binding protein [Hydrogenophaga sp.]|uniref:Bug family tripartite tricarboxylate transporter substrate binding protein n=1 Tax=Hydrogenophaga sp. TaxID=1904254 RepID=UPI00271933F9|nr:tripartite tricarboxylate transporter substrate binding protein [Hydrogenophaga sp.]MDO9435385.1 tripartite tricarboxylate transporter substrate binding protein [Hydrogenophaga sp.]
MNSRMTNTIRRSLMRGAGALTVCAGAALVFALPTQAADWPERPLKLLVGFAPGGSVDIVARLLAEEMSKSLGQAVVVENRPGASTAIAVGALTRSTPDGYTLMLLSSTNAIAPALSKAPSYRPLKDFSPISIVAKGPIVIAVSQTSPLKTFKDVVEAAKASPDKLNYGAGGNATSMHLAALLLQKELGLSMVHVPYKGGSETLTGLLSDQIQLQFATPASLASSVGTRVRAIAVTSPTRFPELPSTPTVAELAVPGFDVSVWYMLAAPAGLPASVAARLNATVKDALASPDLKKRLTAEGVVPSPSSVEQAQKLMASEVPRWDAIVKGANLASTD